MAVRFGIEPDRLKQHAEEYQKIYRQLENCNQTVQSVCGHLPGNNYEVLKDILARIMEKNGRNVQDIQNMKNAADRIACMYENTEKRVTEHQNVNTSLEEKDKSGQSSGSENTDKAANELWEYIMDALEQALLGDFSDENNMFGITLCVLLGFVPIVGQICDVRDLIADIYNLFDDGPQTAEWVALGFTVLSLIPGIGDLLKHSDELTPFLKRADDVIDGFEDFFGGILKKSDEVFSVIRKPIDAFNAFMEDKIYKHVPEILNPDHGPGEFVKEWLEEFLQNETVDWFDKYVDGEQSLSNVWIGEARIIDREVLQPAYIPA